jgi:hypothetical protein
MYSGEFEQFWKVVYKYFDDRGFGDLQTFVTWLLLPFVLSFVLWYFAIVELNKMGRWNEQLSDQTNQADNIEL